MKKLLLLFALLGCVTFTACDMDDDNGGYYYDEDRFVGELTVIPLDGGDTYTWENNRVGVLEERDGTLTLWLYNTRFVPQMPAMTMAVPGITYAMTPTLLSLLGDNIVPYMGGDPYRDYLITNLSGTIDASDRLNISFNCMNFRVTFIGDEYNY